MNNKALNDINDRNYINFINYIIIIFCILIYNIIIKRLYFILLRKNFKYHFYHFGEIH